MNKTIFLLLLYVFNTLSFYAYDSFNNRAVPLNYGENIIYYTSDIFHSIEYSDKNKSCFKTNNTNINNNPIKLKLRKISSSKSLPILR